MSSFSYDDAAGQRHEILVRRTAAGDWEVLDTFASDTQVIETLDGHVDAEPQAEVGRPRLPGGRSLPTGTGART